MDFHGPATNDTGFQVTLPGIPIGLATLVDDQAYIVTLSNDLVGYDGETAHLTETALWRIDLATAEVERLFDLPEGHLPVLPSPAGPDRILLQDVAAGELYLMDVASGEELWRARALEQDLRDNRFYHRSVQVDETLFVAFIAAGLSQTVGTTTIGPLSPSPRFGITALDVVSGETLWTWVRSDTQSMESWSASLAADEDRVYLYMRRAIDTNQFDPFPDAVRLYDSEFEIRAHSAQNGAFLWNRTDTTQSSAGVFTPVIGHGTSALGYGCCGYPSVTDTAVHIRLDSFEALNPVTGEPVWTSEAGRSDHIQMQGSNGMGVHGDTVIATSLQSIYRLDSRTGDVRWQYTDPDQWYAGLPIAIYEDTAYVARSGLTNDCFLNKGMEAHDLATGSLLWQWEYEPAAGRDDCGSNQTPGIPSFGPGFMVWGAKDGSVIVLGETAASLGAPRVDISQYPEVEEEVTVDLSGADPGALGPPTRYMVDWGDGTVTDWQEDPAFNHTYHQEGDVEARFTVGNDANQTASTFVTFHVGEDPPPELNFLQEMFTRDNQDMTFGVLGILVAVTGGVVGVTHQHRKRGRLQKELQLLEDGYGEFRDKPSECEAFLDTRKARARSLTLDGELGEEQSRLVEARAEELRREMRSGALEEEFGFLPYTLVTKAREMLEDGRVTSLEAEAFFTALKEVEGLSNKQRALVRERVEAWFARDTGGKNR